MSAGRVTRCRKGLGGAIPWRIVALYEGLGELKGSAIGRTGRSAQRNDSGGRVSPPCWPAALLGSGPPACSFRFSATGSWAYRAPALQPRNHRRETRMTIAAACLPGIGWQPGTLFRRRPQHSRSLRQLRGRHPRRRPAHHHVGWPASAVQPAFTGRLTQKLHGGVRTAPPPVWSRTQR